MKKGFNWKLFLICILIVYGVAFLGSLFTDTGNWYDSIKPSITPPNYIFPIVWNILFFLIAISLYISYSKAKKNEKKPVRIVFGINLLLNMFWSFLFFKIKRPDFAFFELIILWLSIISMIYTLYKIDKKASYLLVPYLIWVSFAGVLNYLIAFS